MKPALGKGLSALIPEQKQSSGILELDINIITPNEYQPRRFFDDKALDDLVSSIREKGVIQPVIVRRISDRAYELIAGERRWRASKKAGLDKIPAIVKEAAPAEALELALIENIQREDLNPLETAEAFQRLIKDFSLTHDELSKKVGKDRATVTNYLRILKLPSEVKRWIAEGSLSIGHAKALLQIDDPIAQTAAARKIIKNGLSVREAEALSKKTSNSRPKPKASRDPQIASLEEKLIQSLGTKVRLIHKSKKGGKIEIEYYSLEELDRLLEILT
ncbi:MAG: ParB/RepB/Spo0J family partition protein [Thermodesulfovibrionia bacterium]|nr:ParB/RepB/Spo0J family partition protein [Thermodesulfovibrionia bacterium]